MVIPQADRTVAWEVDALVGPFEVVIKMMLSFIGIDVLVGSQSSTDRRACSSTRLDR
jgi:hypothetical protein